MDLRGKASEDELCEGRKKKGVLTEVRAGLQKDDDRLSRPKANLQIQLVA